MTTLSVPPVVIGCGWQLDDILEEFGKLVFLLSLQSFSIFNELLIASSGPCWDLLRAGDERGKGRQLSGVVKYFVKV